MVAITVILAAVIGTFVLGLGDQVQSTAPQASFNFDYQSGGTGGDTTLAADSNDGKLTITHDGGDSVVASALSIKDDDGTSISDGSTVFPNTDVSAGDSADVQIAADDTVRVTWTGESGDNTATLGKFSGPNA
jgi:FlaG/FlaF family flagellin (archaellin)